MEEKNSKEKQENMQIHFKDFDIAFKTKTPNITKDLPFICELFNAFLQEVYFASDKMIASLSTNTIVYARWQFDLVVSGKVVTDCYSSDIIINNTEQDRYSLKILEGDQIYLYEQEADKVYYLYQYIDGFNDIKIVDDMRIKAKPWLLGGNNTQIVTVAINGNDCLSFGVETAFKIESNINLTITY